MSAGSLQFRGDHQTALRDAVGSREGVTLSAALKSPTRGVDQDSTGRSPGGEPGLPCLARARAGHASLSEARSAGDRASLDEANSRPAESCQQVETALQARQRSLLRAAFPQAANTSS